MDSATEYGMAQKCECLTEIKSEIICDEHCGLLDVGVKVEKESQDISPPEYSTQPSTPLSQDSKKLSNHLKRGRKKISNLPKGSFPKPHRVCPICQKSQLSANLVRHMKGAHKIQDLNEIARLSKEASISGPTGPRAVDFDDLPTILKANWHKKIVRKDTYEFLKKYQLYLAQEDIN